ncbi:MAG: hypothetical protein EZS28_012920 [Streblomastix strix]|uniref:Tyr recombinase domain-containing protein n=1 Tax=Streblomastix strix TaxID=222440 RepID=A0A5J4W9K6_9EUKA|nr:MAG: hypothetical protein EZS28_012920 [Streblomastix strix]
MRPAEIDGISLRRSVICEQTDKVDLRLQPKTKSGLHSHKLPKTRERTACSRAIFFDWLKRIDNKHFRSIRDNKYGALWQNEDITIPAKRGQISLRFKKLLDLVGIKGKQVYSFRHSAATQLVVMGLDETLLNTFIAHMKNSKSTNEYYVFAERLKDNSMIAHIISITTTFVESFSLQNRLIFKHISIKSLLMYFLFLQRHAALNPHLVNALVYTTSFCRKHSSKLDSVTKCANIRNQCNKCFSFIRLCGNLEFQRRQIRIRLTSSMIKARSTCGG